MKRQKRITKREKKSFLKAMVKDGLIEAAPVPADFTPGRSIFYKEKFPREHLANLQPGDHLWSTCRDAVFGTVVSADVEAQTISFVAYSLSTLLCFEDDDCSDEIAGKFHSTHALVNNIGIDSMWNIDGEVIPAVFRCDEKEAGFQFGIELIVPWVGCHRCVASFWVMRRSEVSDDYYGEQIANCWKPGDELPGDWSKYAVLK